ncbi:ATP-binding protein [Brumimicrobium oceani]|uniref:AAA family ATPase n=1 Tax=Brumimicrobium oceani TaxID=2100725 RepID=A0A2U2XCS5_9FLAO|nr:AAA family ATPase [Brumimicrobium oceani]PWH85592.1 AAA family ATPase [Brumimicrobium oceani]
MEELLLEFQSRMLLFQMNYKRYLFDKVDLSNRLIAIKGVRGVGKTTLLLQFAKFNFPKSSTLYVSMDHVYFYENNLYEMAKEFDNYGGTHLLLDEVHKYPNWSREIKLIYDNLPRLNVVLTSSSVLELYKSESDLSRRMVSYDLHELSFREFLFLETGLELTAHSLSDLMENHVEIAGEILQHFQPLPLFEKYLKVGAYPYFMENEQSYYHKVMTTINLMIEVDIMAVENLRYETIVKFKKLLKAIATSVPFTPNISKLSERIGLSRNSLVESIKTLNKVGIIQELYKDATGIGLLTKPEKLLLNNTNLIYVLANENANIGNIRETFFANQLSCQYHVDLAPKGDFLIDRKFTFEVGGKNKSSKQITGVKNSFIAKDNIEVGFGNIIPLWMFGLLY